MDGQGGDQGGDQPQVTTKPNHNPHQCEFSNCNSNTSIDKYKAKHVWRVMGGIQRVPEWNRSEFERNSSHEGTCHEGTTITLGDTRRHSLRCHTQHLQIWRHVMSHCSRNCSNPYAILIDVTRTKRGSWVMPGATTRSRLLLVRLLTYTQLLVAEIQLLIDVTRTTYYKRQTTMSNVLQRSLGQTSAQKRKRESLLHRQHDSWQPQLPKSNY